MLEIDHLELLMRALEQVRQEMGGVELSASQLLLELAERELARTSSASVSASASDSDSDSDSDSAPAPAPVSDTHVCAPTNSGGENAYRTNVRVIVHRCSTCEKLWADTRGGRFELTRASRDRVACDCEEVAGDDSAGIPGHVTRTIPPATRRAVLVRDGGHCQVPGCRYDRYLDLHHILPRARGGGHTPSNLVTVCSTHHELLHRDVVRVNQAVDGSLSWDRGGGEPLGIILAMDGDRAEIDHGYMSEFDGPPGTWCLIDAPPETADDEHVCVEPDPDLPSRFPRGRVSFVLGDEYRMARRDEYLPLPPAPG